MYPRNVAKVHMVNMMKRRSFSADLSKRARRLRGRFRIEEPESRAGMERRAAARATKPIARMAQGKEAVRRRRLNIRM